MTPRRMLLAAGSNAKGQLGIGSYDDAHTFTPCQFRFATAAPSPRTEDQRPDSTSIGTGDVDVARIACGANHTVVLLRHAERDVGGATVQRMSLWGAGDGRRGQLGVGWQAPRAEAHGDEASAGPSPWTTFCALALALDAVLSSDSEGWTYKDVAAAWETTYVVLARPGRSDVLLAMGSDDFELLGGGGGAPGTPRIVGFDHLFPHTTLCVRRVHAGPRHVVAEVVMRTDASARDENVLIGWGASRHGQLGPEHGGARCVARPVRLPIRVDDDPVVSCALGNQHTVVLHASGRISALGSNKQGQIPSLEDRVRICGLGCTWNSTFMQTVDGDKLGLLSTGNNAEGQLSRGSAVESSSAVALPEDRALSSFVCGSEHVLATVSSSSQEDSVVGWGWNEHGNMGVGSVENIAIPTQLWPREDIDTFNKYPQRVIGIWAGYATSWLLVE